MTITQLDKRGTNHWISLWKLEFRPFVSSLFPLIAEKKGEKWQKTSLCGSVSTANTSVSDTIFLLPDSDQIFFMTPWAAQITGNLIISSEILEVRFCEPPCNPYQVYTRWQIWRTLVTEIPSAPCHHNNNISKLNPLVPTVMRCKVILLRLWHAVLRLWFLTAGVGQFRTMTISHLSKIWAIFK